MLLSSENKIKLRNMFIIIIILFPFGKICVKACRLYRLSFYFRTCLDQRLNTAIPLTNTTMVAVFPAYNLKNTSNNTENIAMFEVFTAYHTIVAVFSCWPKHFVYFKPYGYLLIHLYKNNNKQIAIGWSKADINQLQLCFWPTVTTLIYWRLFTILM